MAVVPNASIPTQPKPTAVAGVIPGANVPQAPSSTPTIPGANIPQPPQFDESYRNKDWTEQLKMFQSDPDLAGHEYQRAMNAANLYKATGNTDAYNKAQTWLNQIQTATGGRMTLPKAPTTDPAQQQYEQYQNQLNDLMGQLKSFAQPMQYNPATDPQAIAYKQYYDNLAKQGSQNAMEEMNSRGLLNSSMTAGEIAKAQQDANLAYGTKVADLGQQFYQRQQDQFNNTARLIGLLGDQQQRLLDNQHWNQTYGLQRDQFNLQKQNQEFNQGLETQKFDYQKLQDQIKNGQWNKQFDLEMQKWADQKGLNWAQLDLEQKKALAQLAIEQRQADIAAMNAQTSRMNALTNADQFAWSKDPNNPINMYHKAMANYRDTGANNTVDKAYQDAMSMALKADPLLFSKPQEVQDQIINGIYSKLKGNQPQSGGGLSDQELMQQLSQYMK